MNRTKKVYLFYTPSIYLVLREQTFLYIHQNELLLRGEKVTNGEMFVFSEQQKQS